MTAKIISSICNLFSLRAHGMHFSLCISAGRFIVVVVFCVCEERDAVYWCTHSEYIRFFEYNLQISNHSPFSRVLSYKKYFSYYTGCMFTIFVLFLFFYASMSNRCAPP